MKNITKLLFIIILLNVGSLSELYASNQCEIFFQQTSSSSKNIFKNVTIGSYLRAIRGVLEINDSEINQHIGERLLSIEEATNKSQIRDSDLKFLANKYGLEINTLNANVISYKTLDVLIEKLISEKLDLYAFKKSENNGKTFEEVRTRLSELEKIKFLARLTHAPFAGSALNIGEGGFNRQFMDINLRTIDLVDLVRTLNLPSRFFTKRNIYDFFHIEKPINLFYIKEIIPYFIPYLMKSNVSLNWNYIIHLIAIYKSDSKYEELPTIAHLATEVDISSIRLDRIIHHGAVTTELEHTKLLDWVKNSLSTPTKKTVNLKPERTPDFELSGAKPGQTVKVYFKAGHKTNSNKLQSQESTKKPETPKSNDTKTHEPLDSAPSQLTIISTDYFHEVFDYSDSISFSTYVSKKMQEAMIKFNLTERTLLNRIGITKTIWDLWQSQYPLPEDIPQRKALEKLLLSIEKNKPPLASSKRKYRKRKNKSLHGEIINLDVNQYLKENKIDAIAIPHNSNDQGQHKDTAKNKQNTLRTQFKYYTSKEEIPKNASIKEAFNLLIYLEGFTTQKEVMAFINKYGPSLAEEGIKKPSLSLASVGFISSGFVENPQNVNLRLIEFAFKYRIQKHKGKPGIGLEEFNWRKRKVSKNKLKNNPKNIRAVHTPTQTNHSPETNPLEVQLKIISFVRSNAFDKENLGESLKALRQKLNFSTKQFAEYVSMKAIGLDPSNYKLNFNQQNLIRIERETIETLRNKEKNTLSYILGVKL